MDNIIIYKEIPGYTGYRIGTNGSLESCKIRGSNLNNCDNIVCLGDTWCKVKPMIRKDKRIKYDINNDNNVRTTRYASYFVLITFVGPRPEGMEACHNDGDCTNDNLYNLRWDTHRANIEDKWRHGTMLKGEQIANSKLTKEDILKIRELSKSGMSHAAISRIFTQVCVRHIGSIIRQERWKHLV